MEHITAEQAWQVLKKSERIYSVAEVEAALDEIAAAITADLHASDPLIVCVMNGGLVPLGMLLPKLAFPLQVDYVHATRYGPHLDGRELQWISGPCQPFEGRVVLLVDDILDEGKTLAAIEQRYLAEGAAKVYKAVLVVKQREREIDIAVEYSGLDVPDRYVFGYGMDYKGYLRNAPGIYAEVK